MHNAPHPHETAKRCKRLLMYREARRALERERERETYMDRLSLFITLPEDGGGATI